MPKASDFGDRQTQQHDEPSETPNHLGAPVFDHLKLDYKTASFPGEGGRPMPLLTDGEPIAELV